MGSELENAGDPPQDTLGGYDRHYDHLDEDSQWGGSPAF